MSFLCPACGASSIFTISGAQDETAQNELTTALIANLRQAQAKLAEGKSDDAHFRIESAINVLKANILTTNRS